MFPDFEPNHGLRCLYIEVIRLDDEYVRYLVSMDAATLEDLMTRHGQDVWNYAHFMTKNRSMADDISQDVFIQAYRHVTSFRGEASIKTWLLKITRNTSYNYLRSAFIRRVLLVDHVLAGRHDSSAEQAFIDQEAANEVWRQVYQLPTKYREVLVLHAGHQLGMREMAQILNVPEGTVKSRLFSARKRLSALLQKEEFANESI
jgi:RNA polymerase sigma-70 factor (ECF subfamily)